MADLYLGLLHYPVLNRAGQSVAAAITGLDLTDIARSACTYQVRRYFLINPLPSQRRIAERMLRYWLEAEPDPSYRQEALQRVTIVATLEDSLRQVFAAEGQRPLLVGTSARRLQGRSISYSRLRAQLERERQPVCLLFGTGWGLAAAALELLDCLLPPLEGPGDYNHLSVRAAAAIVLDRLRGRTVTQEE